MKIILLSGGSGTRLWPMSSMKQPKQFLKFMTDEQGESYSMLQKVWSRLKRIGMEGSAVIATGVTHRDLIWQQLGKDVDMVLEPEKKDTFPAILLAVAYLNSHKGLAPDEPVLVMPVDSMADDLFYDKLFELPRVLEGSDANLALLGVKPNRPSEKFGYMIPYAEPMAAEGILRIERFQEKPSLERAAELIAAGALWNCGVFCFRAEYMLAKFRTMRLPDTYEELLLNYHLLHGESFDYAVVEKENAIAAMQYEGKWKDLGTWCSITGEMKRPVSGKGVMTDDCSDVHIVNETGLPVVVMGLSDVVVAASDEGILVTHKSVSSRLKEALALLSAADMQEGTAGDEGKMWSKTIDSSLFADSSMVTTRRIHLGRDCALSYSSDTAGSARVTWTLIHGKAFISRNGERLEAGPGRTVTFDIHDVGELVALDPVDLIECSTLTY